MHRAKPRLVSRMTQHAASHSVESIFTRKAPNSVVSADIHSKQKYHCLVPQQGVARKREETRRVNDRKRCPETPKPDEETIGQ